MGTGKICRRQFPKAFIGKQKLSDAQQILETPKRFLRFLNLKGSETKGLQGCGSKKVCLACSAGGHLTELLQLEAAWKGRPHFFVSDKRLNAIDLAKREKVLFVSCPRRNPLKLALNFAQSMRIFLREKPDAIISTGADTAIPICLIAKLFRRKIVFIESFCRVKEPSLSGKIMYGKANLFLVQWKQNKKFFPKAEFAGSVF